MAAWSFLFSPVCVVADGEPVSSQVFPVASPETAGDDRIPGYPQFPDTGAEPETAVSFDRFRGREFLSAAQVGEDGLPLGEGFRPQGRFLGVAGKRVQQCAEETVRILFHGLFCFLVSVTVEYPAAEDGPAKVVPGLDAVPCGEERDSVARDVA